MATAMEETVLIISSDDEDDVSGALADERPPSDGDYESSVTVSSDSDDSEEEEDDAEDEAEDDAEDDEVDIDNEVELDEIKITNVVTVDDDKTLDIDNVVTNGVTESNGVIENVGSNQEDKTPAQAANEDVNKAVSNEVTTNGLEVSNSTNNNNGQPETSGTLKKKKSPAKKKSNSKSPKKKSNSKSPTKKKSGSKTKKPRKKNFERRNIRKIIAETKLDENTVNAQKEEEERKRRVAERAQVFAEAPNLKSLLTEASGCFAPFPHKDKPRDVVYISSDDDKEEEDDDDDDCCIIVDQKTEDRDEGSGDPENSGIHVDDSKNQPDNLGRVLVNVGHPTADPDVFLAPQITRAIKPHQIGGIRFLYDNLVESLLRFKESTGFGCILAHSMGLGKTLQVVAFTDVFMRSTNAKRVLIIVPINTLQNWLNEFDMWLPEKAEGVDSDNVQHRSFPLYTINDALNSVSARAKVIEKWTLGGGVLLMGYEMFRLLATRNTKTRKRKANAGPEVIDIDLEEKNVGLQFNMQQALLNPGPDLVICDEGHRIKNSRAGISKSLKQIDTKRRVVLTGYPLQNNLTEYWCMVDFVRPDFLGTKVEFSNMFERPISNGQCADSTPQDVKLMRYRAHVLHTLLEGFVQRRNHKVLMKNLPPKEEWVLMIKMSEFQRKVYNLFMENLQLDADSCIGGTNPLKAFAVACKIWNHPDVMQTFLGKQALNDLELDVGLTPNGSASLTNGSSPLPNGNSMIRSASESALTLRTNERRDSPLPGMFGGAEKTIDYDWVKPEFDTYIPGAAENSGKFVILFQIITETLQLNEKLLVFSQSLVTLNLLERFLSKMYVPLPWMNDKWAKNQTYYRLDGSTSASERERLINQFNRVDNKDACLFLLSTKAGCLGINLIGANRVVMLDASWNPCHDCQAVCRVYRYGQDKPCFIYRFVSDNTMERKIYDRQVSKQGMADRVVDEIQVQNQFSKKENDQLLEYQDKELPTIDPTGIEERCFDPVLASVIKRNHSWITQNPFTHESLLVEAQDQRLTRNDKRLAREAYERDKKFSSGSSRSYANYYQNKLPPRPPMFRGPTLPPANNHMMRPSMSTPQLRTPQSFDFRGNMRYHNAAGPTVQTINARKDITAPDGKLIKKGDPIVVMTTAKGTFIKLADSKMYAVHDRKDAETYGIADSNVSNTAEPDTNDSEQRLADLLHDNRRRQVTPNFVERRHNVPNTDTTSGTNADISADTSTDALFQLPTSQLLPVDSLNGGNMGHNTSTSNSMMSQLPYRGAYPNHPLPPSTDSFGLTSDNFYQHISANSSNNNSTELASLSHSYNQPIPSQYPTINSAEGYQSQQFQQYPNYGWGHSVLPSCHTDPLNIHGTLTMRHGQMQSSPVQQAVEDMNSLPHLNHLLRMQPHPFLGSLDESGSPSLNGYDSDLPSLGNSPAPFDHPESTGNG